MRLSRKNLKKMVRRVVREQLEQQERHAAFEPDKSLSTDEKEKALEKQRQEKAKKKRAATKQSFRGLEMESKAPSLKSVLLERDDDPTRLDYDSYMDPVGVDDGEPVPVGTKRDIDNDGDVDDSDAYLATRRQTITKAVKNEEDLDEEGWSARNLRRGPASVQRDRDPVDDWKDEDPAREQEKTAAEWEAEDEQRKSLDEEEGDDEVMTTRTYGDVPSEDELEKLMDGESFPMKLSNEDRLAFDYAMEVNNVTSDAALGADIGDAQDMKEVLEALVNAPDPENLSGEEYETIRDELEEWYERYPDKSIEDSASNVASGILQVLGVEWI